MKKTLPLIFNILVVALFGALCALLITGVGALNFDKTQAIILTLVGILVSILVVPFLHELGHLVFGLANNMSFYSLKVGFFMIYRQSGSLKIRLVRAGEYAGACEMIPKNSKNLYRRFLMMAMGGNIFTFLVLVISTGFFVFKSQFAPQLYFFIAAMLPVSAYLFLVNALPQTSGQRSDGAVIYGLIKKNPAAMATVNILSIQSTFFQGKTPSEIDKKLYFEIPETDDVFIKAITLNLQYVYFVDANELEKARQTAKTLETLAYQLDENTCNNILSDCLYEYLLIGDLENINKLYTQVERYLNATSDASKLRIRAAYAFMYQKNYKLCRALINSALSECEHMTIKGIALFEKKLLLKLKAQLEFEEKLLEEKQNQTNINKTRIF